MMEHFVTDRDATTYTITIDDAFKNAGQVPGVEVWRVENFRMIRVEEKKYGSFYSGDCYLILKTYKNRYGSLEWNIHYWLGEESSQDEHGTVAIKAVELDESLGGKPIQHREVMLYESDLFLSAFPNGVAYLDGGTASGFVHVEKGEYLTRLFRVKGKRLVRIWKVKCDVSSLNKSDSFILDTDNLVYVWNGPNSHPKEKLRATNFATQLKDNEKSGRGTVKILQHWKVADEFYRYLNGTWKDIPDSTSDSESDEVFDAEFKQNLQLFRVSDESQQIRVDEIARAPLKQKLLNSQDCFIVNAGKYGIYVWIGTRCSLKEKACAVKAAEEFLKVYKCPKWTLITKVHENSETVVFKSFFRDWKDNTEKDQLESKAKKMFDELSFDLSELSLHAKSAGTAANFMPDSCDGKIECLKLVPQKWILDEVPSRHFGLFYDDTCYVIKYKSEKQKLLYLWRGNRCGETSETVLEEMVNSLEDDMGNDIIKVSFVSGKEPEHFLRLFKGKLIIRHAKAANEERQLYHIKGSTPLNIRAKQVKCLTTSLNSDDSFIAFDPNKVFIWYGKFSNDLEKQFAQNMVKYLHEKTPSIIKEERETNDFWSILGAKRADRSYVDIVQERHEAMRLSDARLFHCYHTGKCFKIEEIHNLSLDELIEDDVMLMDDGDVIFVWIGNGSSDVERLSATKMAQKYLSNDPASARYGTPIITIHQGSEPKSFLDNFD
ncbi:hypothetical protein SNEBB_007005 [Seison nebaliae]|nr:hypothetical protein SNEBB_007005 [Seison nebaliae]